MVAVLDAIVFSYGWSMRVEGDDMCDNDSGGAESISYSGTCEYLIEGKKRSEDDTENYD